MAAVDFPAHPYPGSTSWTTSNAGVIGDETALSTVDGDTSRWQVIYDGSSQTIFPYFTGPFPTNYAAAEWVMVARTNGQDVAGTQMLFGGLAATFPTISGTTYAEYVVDATAGEQPLDTMLSQQETYPDYYHFTIRTMTTQGDLHMTYLAVRFHVPGGHAPPLRQYPRSDGLATSSARRMWPPSRSYQRGIRRAGGYL